MNRNHLPVTPGMSAPVSTIQKRLEKLEPSDSKYPPLLRRLLDHQDLKSHVQNLNGSGLEGFVELLDQVCETGVDVHQY